MLRRMPAVLLVELDALLHRDLIEVGRLLAHRVKEVLLADRVADRRRRALVILILKFVHTGCVRSRESVVRREVGPLR